MNLDLNELSKQLRRLICDGIEVIPKGVNSYQVLAPFYFDDGDGYVVYLKTDEEGIYLTDNGHTLMHLSYWLDTSQLTHDEGERGNLFNGVLKAYGVVYTGGRLTMRLPREPGSIGNYFLTYIQAITKITDIDYLSRERVRRSFLDDLIRFMKDTYGKNAQEKWSNSRLDREGTYAVDIRLDLAKVPIYVYAAWSNERALNVVVSILTHKDWKESFRSLVIHEYVDELSKPNIRKVMDASDKQVSAFYGKQDEIKEYIEQEIEYMGGT